MQESLLSAGLLGRSTVSPEPASSLNSFAKFCLQPTAGLPAAFLVLAAILVGLREGGVAIGWGIQFQQPLFLCPESGRTVSSSGDRRQAGLGLRAIDVCPQLVGRDANRLADVHDTGFDNRD